MVEAIVKKTRKYNLKSRITSALRRIWRFHPVRSQCYKDALHQKRSRSKDDVYKCGKCDFLGTRGEFDLDHRNPVICPQAGFVNWDTYIDRLFCDPSNLWLLCKVCHVEKTNDEKEIRKLRHKNVDIIRDSVREYIQGKKEVFEDEED